MHNYQARPIGYESAYGGKVWALTCSECGDEVEILANAPVGALISNYNSTGTCVVKAEGAEVKEG